MFNCPHCNRTVHDEYAIRVDDFNLPTDYFLDPGFSAHLYDKVCLECLEANMLHLDTLPPEMIEETTSVGQMFYNGIIVPLLGLKPSPTPAYLPVTLRLAYEPRQNYAHNYLRDLHLAERDTLIVGQLRGSGGRYVVILRVNKLNNHVVVYKEAMEYLFNNRKATKELLGLLKEFYTTEIQERSTLTTVDTSDNRYGNNIAVYDIP